MSKVFALIRYLAFVVMLGVPVYSFAENGQINDVLANKEPPEVVEGPTAEELWEQVMRIVPPFPDSELNSIQMNPRTEEEAQAVLMWKEQASVFKQSPENALERFPDEVRVRAANEVLEAVIQKYSGISERDTIVREMQHYLAGQIEAGVSIPSREEAFKVADIMHRKHEK